MKREQARTLAAAAAVEDKGGVVTVRAPLTGREKSLALGQAWFSHDLCAPEMRWLLSNAYLRLVRLGDETRVRLTEKARGYLASGQWEKDLKERPVPLPEGTRRCAWPPCGQPFTPKTPEQLCCKAGHKAHLKNRQKIERGGTA